LLLHRDGCAVEELDVALGEVCDVVRRVRAPRKRQARRATSCITP
jgi:hypothetical protein